MSHIPPPPPRWPGCLAAAVAALREAPSARRSTAQGELWFLLHAALYAALRSQAGWIGGVRTEDLEDLASQKSLELLLRAEKGTWDLGGHPDREVAAYVARVARHALVDLARRRGRECAAPDDPEAWAVVLAEHGVEAAGPEDRVAAGEFTRALRECVETLAPRARQAWFRRVYLERPSREIAVNLGLKPGHVDVVVQRARAALRHCMEAKGQRDVSVRPGAFVELWRAISSEMDGPVELDREG